MNSITNIADLLQKTKLGLADLISKTYASDSIIDLSLISEFSKLISPLHSGLVADSVASSNAKVFRRQVRATVTDIDNYLDRVIIPGLKDVASVLASDLVAASSVVHVISDAQVSGNLALARTAQRVSDLSDKLLVLYPEVDSRHESDRKEEEEFDDIADFLQSVPKHFDEYANRAVASANINSSELIQAGNHVALLSTQCHITDEGSNVNIVPYDGAGAIVAFTAGRKMGVCRDGDATTVVHQPLAANAIAANTQLISFTNKYPFVVTVTAKVTVVESITDVPLGITTDTLATSAAMNLRCIPAGGVASNFPFTANTTIKDNVAYKTFSLAPDAVVTYNTVVAGANDIPVAYRIEHTIVINESVLGVSLSFRDLLVGNLSVKVRSLICESMKSTPFTKELRTLSDYDTWRIRTRGAQPFFKGVAPAANATVTDDAGAIVTPTLSHQIFDPCWWLALKLTHPQFASLALMYQRFMRRLSVFASILRNDVEYQRYLLSEC